MRLFVALNIDPEIRQRIGDFRNKMRAYAPDVRWVEPETFHITLQFIGETEKLAEIRDALQHVQAAAIPHVFSGWA
jgi:2'-5' RNA ligase